MGNMQPLTVTKSLQAYVKLNGMPVDGWPLYKLGIIDKEIACILASKHDLVKLVGITSYLVVITCYLVVMTLLTCGNDLVSCGNDFANLWKQLSILW